MLHLERRPISGGYNWLYYYVDNNTRSLFWIQEFDIIDELPEVTGIKTLYSLSGYFYSIYRFFTFMVSTHRVRNGIEVLVRDIYFS